MINLAGMNCFKIADFEIKHDEVRMADLKDYIKWRGDLTFEQAPFNEVDNIIFSFISYVDFEGIVPQAGENGGISIREASEMFWQMYTEKQIMDKPTLTKMSAFALREMADSRRFGGLMLSEYVNEIDEDEQKQFSAMQVQLTEDVYYLVFRGTDETIVGWQEDFNMVYLPEVPSEKRAVAYMDYVMGQNQARYYIGGHSKGGHMAVYAAVRNFEKYEDRILMVFNNDGPGVSEAMAETKAYQKLLSRLVSYVPEQTFFGLMLIHKEVIYAVKSNRSGLLQHDLLSWEVMGPRLVKVEQVSLSSRSINDGLKKWLNDLVLEEREEIITLIFNSLCMAQIRTIGDFTTLTPKKIYDMIRKLKGLDAKQKTLVTRCFRLLVQELKGRGPGTAKRSLIG